LGFIAAGLAVGALIAAELAARRIAATRADAVVPFAAVERCKS